MAAKRRVLGPGQGETGDGSTGEEGTHHRSQAQCSKVEYHPVTMGSSFEVFREASLTVS
jgi:hypothetical protein